MWGLLGICFVLSSNIVFIITTGTSTFVPYLAGILYSFAFTFFGCAMWATPGFVVPVYQLTTAYGMLSSLIASTIAITSISAGMIIDNFGYFLLLVFFITIFVVIILLIILLSVLEVVSENILLNVSGRSRIKSRIE